MHRLAALVLLLAPLVVPALATAGPTQGDALQRVVAPTSDLDRLHPALADRDELVTVDPRLDLAVVRTASPEALGERLGLPVELDARARAEAVPNDPRWSDQWGPQALEMPRAWEVEEGATSVIVAVVDSGIDEGHPDLRGADVLEGSDLVEWDADPDDESGHGTHVAGVVAAVRDNGVGVAGMADVTLLDIRVLDENNVGYCSAVAMGIAEAASRGAFVINLSLSCGADVLTVRSAVRYAAVRGALVVAAAGNAWDDDPAACVKWPARYSAAVAVAAVDQALDPAPFSCRGPEIELAAPGVDVVSTLPPGDYAYKTGTSMATPHVSAAAGLLRAHDALLTAQDARTHLGETAQDLDAAGFDQATGHGLVQPLDALAATGGQARSP